MRQFAERLMIAGTIVSVGALWVGGALAQGLTASGSVRASSMGSVSATQRPDGLGRLSAAEIINRMLEKNQERLAALEHYESERTYRVEYNGTGGDRHAELQVHAVYSEPNQKQFTVVSESGSKFMCEKVLMKLVEGEKEATAKSNQMQTTLGPANYDTELLGEETIATGGGLVRAWVLSVTPKIDNKFTYKGKVWVSQDDFAIVRIQGEPAKNPSWWINHASFESDYVRRGDVWLPEKNISSSHVRIGGQATLTIEYGTYQVVEERPLKPVVESAEFIHDRGGVASR